ncbi:hypothetical protein SGRIM119S_02247 [Streptomyces griseorubiginosus]
MPHQPPPSFGIMTAPMQTGYHDILRVWREADAIPAIRHAWLFDHLMPIGGDPDGPAYEGWTLLSALAAQTRRLRLGVMVDAATGSGRPPCWPRSPRPSTSSPTAGWTSASASAPDQATPSRGASTKPTGFPSTTPRTRWAASTKPAR